MTQFHGGNIPTDKEAWTVAFSDGVYCEELDVLAPLGSAPADVKAIARPFIAADYALGMQIIDVSPFRGVTIWSA